MRRTNMDTTHYLRWFFTESQAAVSGMRSSYWTLVEMAQSGAVRATGSGESRTPPQRQRSAAGRESDIAGRLEQLAVDQRVVLALAFGPSPWPVLGAFEQREDKRRLGEHPGVALASERAQRAYQGAVKRRDRKAGEDTRAVVVQRPDRGSFYRLCEDALADATMGGKRVAEIAAEEIVGERTLVFRRGDDPRAGLKAMLDRGLVSWLRGPLVGGQVLSEIREECGVLVKAAVTAWEAVAPKPERCGACGGMGHIARGRILDACEACNGHGASTKRDQRRRAAFGPMGQESDDGDRPSGVYPTIAAASWWRAAG